MQDGEDRADSDSGVMSREDSPMGQGGDRPPIERPPAIADSSASENDDEVSVMALRRSMCVYLSSSLPSGARRDAVGAAVGLD